MQKIKVKFSDIMNFARNLFKTILFYHYKKLFKNYRIIKAVYLV